jgi:endo-1,4-beta-xylanase
MKDRNVPIDGVGLQLHVDQTTNSAQWLQGVETNLQRYFELDIEVHFTEIDVKSTNNNQATQAQMYLDLLNICLSFENCKSFEAWGFTDKYTWLNSNTHPLIFDQNFNEKKVILKEFIKKNEYEKFLSNIKTEEREIDAFKDNLANRDTYEQKKCQS